MSRPMQPGSPYTAAIGCYAHFRKMEGRFSEIDVSGSGAKDKMRSAPVLDKDRLEKAFKEVPKDIESALRR